MERKPGPKLKFKPLSEGLGFHPFSDGLPYAPVRKTATPTTTPQIPPSGATAAGPAMPVTTSSLPAPRISVPIAPAAASPVSHTAPALPPRTVATPAAAGPSWSPASPYAPRPQAQVSPAASVATAAPMGVSAAPLSSTAAKAETRFGFIYLAKRVMAYLLDSAFNVGLCALALGSGLWREGMNPELLIGPGTLMLFVLFLAGFNWAILTAQEVAFGTTLFKRVFGLALEGGAAAIFLRAFFFLPSAGFCGVGLLWAVFDRRRRCWHDAVVNLQPIEIARL